MTRARMPRPHEVAAAKRDPRLLRAVKEQQGDGAWRIRGACQQVDPETFFPAPTEPADAAVALCRTCDVQGACLAWALDVGDCRCSADRGQVAFVPVTEGAVGAASEACADNTGRIPSLLHRDGCDAR